MQRVRQSRSNRIRQDTGPSEPKPRIRGYQVGRFLAAGGRSCVFEATTAQGQRVAIKVLRRSVDSPRERSWFIAEARVLSRLRHSGIAKFVEAGTTEDNKPFLATELIVGTDLVAHCDERRLSLGERFRMFQQVCESVEYLHSNRVLHLDLKPANLLVGSDGRVRVLDFGSAVFRSDEVDRALGGREPLRPLTPEYSSPELLCGSRPDERSDIYSLGLILFELSLGVMPPRSVRLLSSEVASQMLVSGTYPDARGVFGYQAIVGEAADLRSTTPDRLVASLRGPVDWLLDRALASPPDRRFRSVAELRRAIDRAAAGRPLAGRDQVRRLLRVGRKYRGVVLALGLVLLPSVVWFEGKADRDFQKRATIALARAEEIEATLRAAGTKGEPALSRAEDALREWIGRPDAVVRRPWEEHLTGGKAALLLGQSAAAVRHLELAWKAGVRSPLLARSLLEAYSDVVAHGLVDGSITDEVGLARWRVEVERDVRKPARGYVAAAKGLGDANDSYVQVLQSFIDDDVDVAVERSRLLIASSPRYFQVKRLEADALIAKARSLRSASRLGDAVLAAREAETAAEDGLSIAPGDLRLRLRRCRAAALAFGLRAEAGALGDADLGSLEARCDQRLAVFVPEVDATVAWAYADLADFRGRRRHHALESAVAGLMWIESRGLERASALVLARGRLLTLLHRHLLRSDGDPWSGQVVAAAAEVALEQAGRASRHDLRPANLLANLLSDQAHARALAALDFEAPLRRAEEIYRTNILRGGDTHRWSGNLAVALCRRGIFQEWNGTDGREQLRDSIRLLDELLTKQAAYRNGLLALSMCSLEMARAERRRGGAPAMFAGRALVAASKAAAGSSRGVESLVLEAELLLGRPVATLRSRVDELLRDEPDDVQLLSASARIGSVEACSVPSARGRLDFDVQRLIALAPDIGRPLLRELEAEPSLCA